MAGIPDDGRVFVPGGNASAGDLEKLLSPLGFLTVRLDGARLGTKPELMTELASALKFPGYFGRNWDALLDCLRSLPDFMDAGGYALIVERYGLVLKEEPGELETFRDVVGTAAAFLIEKRGIKLKVITL